MKAAREVPASPQATTDATGKKNGRFKAVFADGSMAAIGPYVADQKHGVWTFFYRRTGGKKATGRFVRGELQGPWTWWREDGTLQRTGGFVAGEMDGLWRRYDRAGRIEAERLYSRGQRVQIVRGDVVKKRVVRRVMSSATAPRVRSRVRDS